MKTRLKFAVLAVIGLALGSFCFYKSGKPSQRGVASQDGEIKYVDINVGLQGLEASEPEVSEVRDVVEPESLKTVDIKLDLPKGNLVVFGDSQAQGSFGETLYRKLLHYPRAEAPAFNIRTHYLCASKPWILMQPEYNAFCGYVFYKEDGSRDMKDGKNPPKPRVPTFIEFMRPAMNKPGPRLFIIELGSNMFVNEWMWAHANPPNPPLKEAQKKELGDIPMTEKIIDLIDEVGGKCIWIGPPVPAEVAKSKENFDLINKGLKAAVEKRGCQYIDSAAMTSRSDAEKDGLKMHHVGPAGSRWANCVYEAIEDSLESVAAGGDVSHDYVKTNCEKEILSGAYPPKPRPQ